MDAALQHGWQLVLASALAPAFAVWGTPTSRIEIVACGLALAMVMLNMRLNPVAWPLSAISSLLYVALFWDSRLYGDASLQVCFAVLALWGWWQWARGTQADGRGLQVRTLRVRHRWGLLGALAVAWPAMGLFLARCTDTDVPWWDAFPTAASVIGQWLLGRRYIENWLVWLLVNLSSVGLFAYKGLWLTVLLYAVFVALSLVGWRAWARRSLA